MTKVFDWAFEYSNNITKLTIPGSVTEFGISVFSGCSNLKSVIIMDGVTNIGDNAFENCTSLTSVTIPDGVTSIGDGVFFSCSNLTSITIPDSVTSIGDYTFSICINLTSVTIGDSVTAIGDDAFYGCTRLASIDVSQANPAYMSRDGVLFNKPMTELLLYPKGNSRASYSIPDGVTSIGDGVFFSCSNLASITIPDSVISIGDYTFSNCINLTSVTIGDSVASIGDDAFASCHSLTSITIPESVTSIGDYTFSNCINLTSVTIGGSVASIGDYAFLECGSLTSVEFPGSLTSIGEYAFLRCIGLTSATFTDGLTSIGYGAFCSCYSLASVNIPGSVTSIGDSAFLYCDSLTSIDVAQANPSYVSNDGVLFDKTMSALIQYPVGNSRTSYSIPGGVISVEKGAFSGCNNLTNVTMPDSVTSIGNDAFLNCDRLTDVYYSGSEKDWSNISIDYFNDSLLNANIHYNYNIEPLYTTGITIKYLDRATDQPIKESRTLKNITVYHYSINYDVEETDKQNIDSDSGHYTFDETSVTSIELSEPPEKNIVELYFNKQEPKNSELPAIELNAYGEPTLPERVALEYADGKIVSRAVAWDAVPSVASGEETTARCLTSDGFTLTATVRKFYPAPSQAEEELYKKYDWIKIEDKYYAVEKGAKNLIPNGDFSKGLEDWTNRLGVGLGTYEMPEKIKVEYDSELGMNVFDLIAGGRKDDNTIGTAWTVEPGKAYGFSFCVSGEKPTENNYIYNLVSDSYFDDDGNSAANGNTLLPYGEKMTGGMWSDLSIVFTAQTDKVYFQSGWADHLRFANFRLYEIVSPDIYRLDGEGRYSKISINVDENNAGAFYVEKGAGVPEEIPGYIGKIVGTSELDTNRPNAGTIYMATNVCGDTMGWIFNANAGILKIIGNGAMNDFTNGSPWEGLDIKTVIISGGITGIGKCAFESCTGITDVYYASDEDAWEKMVIGENNDPLTSANIHYNSAGPTPEIKVPEVKPDEATGRINVTVETENVPEAAELIAISYGTDGGFVDIAPVESGAASLDGENAKTVKVFCWESLESMRPLCEAKEVEITQ